MRGRAQRVAVSRALTPSLSRKRERGIHFEGTAEGSNPKRSVKDRRRGLRTHDDGHGCSIGKESPS